MIPAEVPAIRFVVTHPLAAQAEDKALMAKHIAGVGPAWPAVKTPEQESHHKAVKFFQIGYSGRRLYEYICPVCAIRWRDNP